LPAALGNGKALARALGAKPLHDSRRPPHDDFLHTLGVTKPEV
jgi:hypothetical protein